MAGNGENGGNGATPAGPLDRALMLALLEWQAELGADEAMLDQPVDRFAASAEEAAKQAERTAAMAPPAAPAPAPKPDEATIAAAHLAEAKARADKAHDLAALAATQESFDGLAIKRGARNFCFADGNPAARVMIIGEAPGQEEDLQGRPFVGRAGQLLDQMFAAIGLSRTAPDAEHALYITNVVPWRPPGNRRPDAEEIALSLPFLTRHVELAGPDVLVLMGNAPCKAVLNREGITRLRGNWSEAFGLPVLPMTHPAYLLRNPIAKREAWADLLSLASWLEGAPVKPD